MGRRQAADWLPLTIEGWLCGRRPLQRALLPGSPREWSKRKVLPEEPLHFDDLMNTLAKAQRIQNILMDDLAIRACRENCKEVCALEEDIPKKGGNIARYAQLCGASGAVEADNQAEYTFCKFEGETGEEFLALQLLLDWEGMNEGRNKGRNKDIQQ